MAVIIAAVISVPLVTPVVAVIAKMELSTGRARSV